MKNDSLLTRRVDEVIVRKDLEAKLAAGKPLRVKFGIDPTGADVHIGHAVPIRKLKEFQELGHRIVLIIGDYTALIGDPTGKDLTRPPLSVEQIRKNTETFLDQIGKIIDIPKTEIHYNSEWLGKLDFPHLIGLISKVTFAQMMAKSTFRKRVEESPEGLALHELLYPIMQGYDSVEIRADIELGGVDQKFNLLMGRELQKAYGQPPQDIVMMKYLLGTDGVEKMGKSLGNYIAIGDAPADMYGKVMSIPDDLIGSYAELATDVNDHDVARLTKLSTSGKGARDAKAELAREIVKLYHGEEPAKSAEAEFNQVFAAGELPSEVAVVSLHPKAIKAFELLVAAGLAESNSNARRVIEQRGASVNGRKLSDPNAGYTPKSGDILRIGKRKTAKIEVREE